MRTRLASLRTRILAAILGAVIVTELLAVWVVNDRILAAGGREADAQARAHAAQVRALYEERGSTLVAEAETVSLYPAVIAAFADGNAGPLLQWSGQVNRLQGTSITVTDANGHVIARGHAPEQSGDDLAAGLAGLRQALAGQQVSGTEEGDELGLALRGYAPVLRDGRVLGAIMVAEPFDERLLRRLLGDPDVNTAALRVEAAQPDESEGCVPSVATATCHFSLWSPAGAAAASLALVVSLADIERGRTEAQQLLWISGVGVLLAGAGAAWLLARSLTRPLARLTAAASSVASGVYADEPLDKGHADEIGTLSRAFALMRRQVGAATTALRDERDVLDAVLQSAGDGIVMLETNGTLVLANERWTEMLGAEGGLAAAADLAGAGLRGSASGFEAAVRDWLVDPDRVAVEDFERLTPSAAAYRRFRCYTAPVRSREGTTIGRILVLRDVTRESEAERMRTALVSNVSHELRSPLSSIKGYVETLIQGGPWEPELEHEFLEIIAGAADKLGRLVDNLLDAAKMDAGVLSLEYEPVRVERIVAAIVSRAQPLTARHELRIEAEPGLPLVSADPMRVEQVINNLLDNAIKYSPPGEPITVQVQGGAMLTVSVTDHGIGIAPEDATHLFERFYRADTRFTRATPGVGLGLHICKSLVEAHGGRIWVESAGAGQGSTFSFTIPALVERASVGRAA